MGQSETTLVEKFDFLKRYDTTNVSDQKKNGTLISVVKKSHVDKDLLSLSEVKKLLTDKAFKKNKNQKCRIKVDIVGLLETEASKVIKVLDTENN